MPQREFEITIGKTGEVEMKSQQQTSEFYEPEEQVQYRIDQRH